MIIEATIIEYLKDKLDVSVVAETPDTEPESYVRIERVGRQVRNLLTTDSIAFQSYGATMYDAALLDDKVQSAVPELTKIAGVSGVHLASNYNSTDTSKKNYRYQCIFDITHK